MKFIHAADLHLDSPLIGLAAYEGAPTEEIRHATRDALDNLISFAMSEEVDFLLISGDVYDGDWKDHNTGLFFSAKMSELRRAGIPAFMISGNHDADNVITKRLVLPENVFQFPTSKPTTKLLEDIKVAIHGQGFRSRSVTNNLVSDYPERIPGFFNIGLLHTSLTGREGHDNYAPCSVADLERLGYDYWALGHVHTREEIDSETPIWFSGNVQGRHIRETGAKGCSLINVTDDGECFIEFVPLDVLRWELLTIDCAGMDQISECFDRFREDLSALVGAAEGRLLALRVIVEGESPIHNEISSDPIGFTNQLRSLTTDSGEDAWLEAVKIKTSPLRNEEQEFDPEGPIAEIHKIVESLASDEKLKREVEDILEPIIQKLPSELLGGGHLPGFQTPEDLKTVLGQVLPNLLVRIRRGKR